MFRRQHERTERRGGERGAALAEFAFCFPVFLLLMMAVVDMGVNYGDKVETAHAAREAARAGSVSKVGNDSSCSITAASTPPTLTRQLFCLAKARTHMDPTDVRVKVFYEGVNGKLTTNYQPAAAGSSSTATIVVCVQSRAESLSGLLGPFLDDKVHESKSLIKTGLPAATASGQYPTAAEETPIPGHDWSFCSAEDPVGTDAA
ncbi:MAG: pilus assembly protein [Microthrixaceae bacterium]|nr:pilus assembly protein [Microthrixaceae bacterium]